MKKITIILTILLSALLNSCTKDFLDQVPDDKLTLEETFSHQSTVENFLANVYSYIPDENRQRFVGSGNSGPWTAGSDEAEYVWSFVQSQNINAGAWDASSDLSSNKWANYYRGIRSAGVFISNVDNCQDCKQALITRFKAEARALRAIYYFNLVKIFGPVVLIDGVIPPDASFDQVQLPRNTLDECIDFVVNELTAAEKDLVFDNSYMATGAFAGRVSKPLCRAVKIQALLYAASPLYNGNTDYAELKNSDGKQLISQQYDAGKWKRAADSARAFINDYVPTYFSLYRENDANGNFSPYLSCRNVMLKDWNSEVIFARVSTTSEWRQYEMVPFHSGSPDECRASGGLGATQEMVDAYFMANGRPISDPLSGYSETGFTNFRAPGDNVARSTFNMWVNREPRFYVGITYSGSRWLNTTYGDIITQTYYSGNSGRKVGGNDYSPTGYIVRKNMTTGGWNVGGRTLITHRLAEVYLNYVEALNEYDPGNPDILFYLNQIRERAGIPQYGSTELPAPVGQAAMRDAIRRERRVELAFENHRFFDVRRWKIADQTENGPKYGLNINADAPSFYERTPFETRVFTKKHYLFPIPQSEVSIDRNMIQNTGW
jgi:hypothetical protein